MTAAEALKICPSIALAHVETLGEGGSSDGGSVVFGGRGGAGASSSSPSAAAALPQRQQQQFVPRKSDRKACLLRYRDASARVLQALRSFFPPGTVVEKASIDEFYVDATASVESMLRPENGGCAVGVCEAAARAPGGAVVVEGFGDDSDDDGEKNEKEKRQGEEDGSGSKVSGSSASSSFPLDPTNPVDARLAAGAVLASGARALILRETGYEKSSLDFLEGGGGENGLSPPPPTHTHAQNRKRAHSVLASSLSKKTLVERRSFSRYTVSAGISHNKLLSKIASARFKPDRQAVVPRRGAPRLLRALPLAKLPGFGGKLGASVSAATGAETAGDVALLPLDAIEAALGGDGGAALAVLSAARGESGSRVAEKAAPKSLMAAKSLDVATGSRPLLERWLSILADELAARLEADGRPPRTLALHYRCRGMGAERSVSGPAPRAARRPAAAAAAGGGGGDGGSAPASSVAVAVPPDAGAIAAAAGVLLTRAMAAAAGGAAAKGAAPPVNRLALVAADFAPPAATGAASIASFFSAPAVQRKLEQAEEEEVEEEEKKESEEEEEKDEEEEEEEEKMELEEEEELEEKAAAVVGKGAKVPREEAREEEEEKEEEDLLSTVDVREQERILREIERGRPAAGAPAAAAAGAASSAGGGRGGGGSGARGGGAKGRGGGKKRDAASAAFPPPPDSKQRSIAAIFGKSGGGEK